ncbi:MAG TPA: TlpA disulfide reductase family protein [Labilithrix sp.]|nr:TlpA disulfide reductase family protein [Labilithrix sp.]
MRHGSSTVVGAVMLFGCGGAPPPGPQPVAAASSEPGPGPDVGAPAPGLSMKAIDGSTVTLARGKVTLVVFWATWSEPDKKELIKLQELHARLGPGTVAVIAVAVDDEPAHLAEFAQTYGLRFPIAWDAGRRVAESYRPSAEPSTYVIDRAGIIRFVHRGYHDGEAEEIATEVTALAR